MQKFNREQVNQYSVVGFTVHSKPTITWIFGHSAGYERTWIDRRQRQKYGRTRKDQENGRWCCREREEKQNAKQGVHKKAKKELKRRETLAKANKKQSKQPKQQTETTIPEKESPGWIIIPGQTQKTH